MSNGEMQNVHIKGIVSTKLNGIGGGPKKLPMRICENTDKEVRSLINKIRCVWQEQHTYVNLV
ncbi:hypothetical protein IX303_001914 [Porphyromonas levii]|nr:hypothetical protein [Porphyromonas levii]